MLIPIRGVKEIEKLRNQFSVEQDEWLLYNTELRFTKAYNDNPASLDTRLWRQIYQENLKLLEGEEEVTSEKVKWEIQSNTPIPGLDKITSIILSNRGIINNIETFINPTLQSPKEIDGTNKLEFASELIQRAVAKNVPITIYGDFDADGVTGVALAVKALRRIGARVDHYINTREEGYPVSELGMRDIASRGTPRLVITVDNGIGAHEAIAFARKANMPVIVTDHHKITKLPNANTVIHSTDFDTPLAGVGVIFKLIEYLYYKIGRKDAIDFLDLVAIGTVADLVPLIGENRALTKYGLEKINKSPSVGVAAIKEALKIKRVKSDTIAFNIGPVINASSRMSGDGEQSLNLLLETDINRARQIASSLIDLNQDRKKLVDKEVKKAEELITIDKNQKILILKSDVHRGVMGIVAGRLKEKYNKPAIILSNDNGLLSGSCRSIEGFDIEESLKKCDMLISHGGHAMAAGLSLKEEDFYKFYEKMLTLASHLKISPPIIKVDGKLDSIDISVVEQIEELEPYGAGFPVPIFMYECKPKEIKVINGKHLKVLGDTNCIIWNTSKDALSANQENLLLLGSPSINDYDNTIQFVAQSLIGT